MSVVVEERVRSDMRTLRDVPPDRDLHRAREIFERYRVRAKRIARKFEIPGAERDDVEQEALLELWKLANRPENQVEPVESLGRLVTFDIKRKLGNVCERARALKHLPVLESKRVFFDPSTGALVDVVDRIEHPDNHLGRDPLVILVEKEFFRDLLAGIATLTPLEMAGLNSSMKSSTQGRPGNSFWSSDPRLKGASSNARRKLRVHLGVVRTAQGLAQERVQRHHRAAALRAKGLGGSAIARELRISKGAARRHLREMGEHA